MAPPSLFVRYLWSGDGLCFGWNPGPDTQEIVLLDLQSCKILPKFASFGIAIWDGHRDENLPGGGGAVVLPHDIQKNFTWRRWLLLAGLLFSYCTLGQRHNYMVEDSARCQVMRH